VPKTCRYCVHPESNEIAKAYERGWTLSKISKKWGGSIDTAFTHKKHLKALVAKAQQKAEAQGRTAYQRFADMMDEAENKYKAAVGPNLQVQWFAQWKGMWELAFKLGIEAQREKTIGPLHDHPRWVFLRTTLMNVLSAFPDARKAVAGALKDLE
jgi:hypothetical protein